MQFKLIRTAFRARAKRVLAQPSKVDQFSVGANTIAHCRRFGNSAANKVSRARSGQLTRLSRIDLIGARTRRWLSDDGARRFQFRPLFANGWINQLTQMM